MPSEYVTYKPMIRPSGDDRFSHGSGPVKVIMVDGVKLPEPVIYTPEPEGVMSEWENLRQRAAKSKRPDNPIHQQPNQKHRGSRPDAAGCKVAADGLHSWMKNGLHPSRKQRWKCLRCKLSDSTEVKGNG